MGVVRRTCASCPSNAVHAGEACRCFQSSIFPAHLLLGANCSFTVCSDGNSNVCCVLLCRVRSNLGKGVTRYSYDTVQKGVSTNESAGYDTIRSLVVIAMQHETEQRE